MKENKKSIFWFRQDLRSFDNIGLFECVQNSENVLPIFILDEHIQKRFGKDDPRFLFLYEALRDLKKQLQQKGSDLFVFHGKPEEVIPDLIKQHNIQALYTNSSYSTYGNKRDSLIKQYCYDAAVGFYSYTDYLILAPETIEYRKVFTPFYKKWRPKVESLNIILKKIELINTDFNITNSIEIPAGKHEYFDLESAKESLVNFDFEHYQENKDFPSKKYGTSLLSPFLRFGIISPRWLYKRVEHINEDYIKELAWREFWHHIRYNFPDFYRLEFQEKRRNIDRLNDKNIFEKYIEAQTGYPIVDAGIRQLKMSNFMHGRIRMVVASFLTKNLLIDWKKGEEFFSQYLLDYDETINIGNWQWSASVGPDPKPLRIFNPILQSQKFDIDGEYIKKYIPELEHISPEILHDPMKFQIPDYFTPIVPQKQSAQRAKEYYMK